MDMKEPFPHYEDVPYGDVSWDDMPHDNVPQNKDDVPYNTQHSQETPTLPEDLSVSEVKSKRSRGGLHLHVFFFLTLSDPTTLFC